MIESCILPSWPVPSRIKAYVTTRIGGVSRAPFNSLNLSYQVEDDHTDVANNQQIVSKLCRFPSEPRWLKQLHGNSVVQLHKNKLNVENGIEGDASFTYDCNVICTILTADCLPIFISDKTGTAVAAIHAGWRGLANGVIEATVAAMNRESSEIYAWLGPAIGPNAFEVGNDVRMRFFDHDQSSAAAFVKINGDHWLADIYTLARIRLLASGVSKIFGGGLCTFSDSERFYSYRRDGKTGRMGSFIWISDAA